MRCPQPLPRTGARPYHTPLQAVRASHFLHVAKTCRIQYNSTPRRTALRHASTPPPDHPAPSCILPYRAVQVYDSRALRVIVDDGDGGQLREAIDVAYRLVGAVHSIWKPIKREFDDYIANPKPSGYQALHTGRHKRKGTWGGLLLLADPKASCHTYLYAPVVPYLRPD